jgi:hypothetical protein
MRLVLAVVMIACTIFGTVTLLAAQDDGDAPLGDVARNLRNLHKKPPTSQAVIDNDNLSKVMDDAESKRVPIASLLFSIDGAGKGFQISSPDATCSLSFSANAKALLASSQYAQMELPAAEVAKLDGPASVDGDSLQVSVFNGTEWHVSEVAVALTLVKRGSAHEAARYDGAARLVPASVSDAGQEQDSTVKRSDVTLLYRMRAAAGPAAVTVFRAPLNVEIGPDQEWHWAIVQAKGYPPQRSGEQSVPPSAPMQAPSPQPVQPRQERIDAPVLPAQLGQAPPPEAETH